MHPPPLILQKSSSQYYILPLKKKNPVSSTPEANYVHGCGTLHCNSGNLLKKVTLPSPGANSRQRLPAGAETLCAFTWSGGS